jgi:ankyrin repeat protein
MKCLKSECNPHKLLTTLLGAVFIFVTAQAAEIHDAAEADDAGRIKELLAKDPKLVRLAGKDDLTPLHSAARQGKLKAVAVLLEHGADVNAADKHGCTPLHSAVYGKHTRVAEFLLDHGANVNAARTDGTTPLYYAAAEAMTNLVSLLLKQGAQPDIASQAGFTPLHAATQAGHLAVAELLVAAGASVEVKDKDGHTPLHTAAKAGRRDMVEWLLNHGADADAKDRLRFKPLDYVVGATNAALVSLLEQHMKPLHEQSLSSKVGEAGDPDRIVFEGLRTFAAEQIQHALAIKPSYLIAAHPQANMRAFLDELKAMVESGYQSSGFPDAKAEVSYDAQAFKVRVNVTEGPRFKAGKIRVMGAKSIAGDELVRWFTTPANTPKSVEALKTSSASKEVKDPNSGETWSVAASASLTLNKRPGELNTPGKASRPDDPMWVTGDPANFSMAWAKQAVAQVEACVAEQGFFFPKATVEIQRDPATGIADLLITIKNEGPPGVVGEINVTGTQRDTPGDLIRFLNLREGMKITAGRLAAARQELRDCGRFWDFEIAPEYVGVDAPASRRVKLNIEVKEQKGVPRLDESLPPVQQALLRLCEWIEQFPERDEDIQVTVSNRTGFPFAVEFVLSPKHGLLLSTGDRGGSPVSAGFLLSETMVQLCAWASGNKLEAPREGGGSFFLHLLPNRSGGSNHFTFSVGAGLRGQKDSAQPGGKPVLDFDVQLARAAFLDLSTRFGSNCFISGSMLMVTHDAFTLRAETATGRLIEIRGHTEEFAYDFRFGVHVWDQGSHEFARRSAQLTNNYAPGRGLSSLVAFVATEVARWRFSDGSTSGALAAMRKLLNPEILSPLDRFLGRNETNTFFVPLDEVDQAIAQNSVAAFFSGFAFESSRELFPKYSWPWTIARETAFVMMSQGRYTDVELDRLYNSEDTGPIGCLLIARLLATAGSPMAKSFALQGLMRLGTQDFLRDCGLFLRGESGLSRSLAGMAEALRTLPENELAALVAVLPEAGANMVRESAAALREKPDAPPATVLSPIIGKYWEGTLQAKVRQALRQLTAPPKGAF